MNAFRFGWYPATRRAWSGRHGQLRGQRQTAIHTAAGTHMVTAPWRPSLTITTTNWPPGSYLLRLDASSGAERYVPITVRSASTAGAVVILNDNTTWQAYNAWGGYSLYQGPDGLPSDRGYAVSFDRPYDGDGAVRFLAFDQAAIALAENTGIPLAYETDVDIDQHPGILASARAVITLGHDEYYSLAMRDAAHRPGTPGPTWPSSARTPSTGTSGSRTGTASSSATRPPPSTRCSARTTRTPPSSGGTRRTRGRRAS